MNSYFTLGVGGATNFLLEQTNPEANIEYPLWEFVKNGL